MRNYILFPAFAAAFICLTAIGCTSTDTDSGSICFCDNNLKAQYETTSVQSAESDRQRLDNETMKAEIAYLDAQIELAKKDYTLAVSEFTDKADEIIEKAVNIDTDSPKQVINVRSELLFTDDSDLQNPIAQSIARQQRSLAPCFEKHHIDIPAAGVKTSVHIGFKNGKANRALITSSDVDDLAWQNCITTGIMSWFFPTTANQITISNEFRFTADKSVGKSDVRISANVVEGTNKQDAPDSDKAQAAPNANNESPDKSGSAPVPPLDPNNAGMLTIQSDALDRTSYYIDGKQVADKSTVENYLISSGTHTARAYFTQTRKFSKSLEFVIEKGFHTTLSFNVDEAPKILSKTKIPQKSGDKKPSASKTSKRSTKRPVDSSFDIPF